MSAGAHQQPGLLLGAGERPPVIHQNRIHLRTPRPLVLTSEQPTVLLFNVLVYVPTGFAVFVRLSEIFQRRELVSVSQYLLLPGVNPLPPIQVSLTGDVPLLAIPANTTLVCVELLTSE